MILVIDAGNSFLKLATFSDETLIETATLGYDDEEFQYKLITWLKKKVTKVGMINVNDREVYNTIQIHCKSPLISINSGHKFPFFNKYKSPQTLGVDRIVACAGAYALNQNKGNFLVIDAGTCITYDLINEHNEYLGGAISPGLRTRALSMNKSTANLPLIKTIIPSPSLIGQDTETCLQSGVVNGINFEIKGYIRQLKAQHENIKVFLTGGDAFYFGDALKNGIFAEPNLVLIGINKLLKLND